MTSVKPMLRSERDAEERGSRCSDGGAGMKIARPDIKPAFARRNLPIVFSTDENYLPYVRVAINSVLANNAGGNLDIIVLYSDISDESIRNFLVRYAGLKNVSVRFVEMSAGLTASRLADFKQVDRLPVSACYRLLIPDILTAYDKLIYLDVDIVVCSDLRGLYATDVDGCYFAAVKDVVHIIKPEYLAWAAGWGFTDWSGYVNTGVLVMNLKQFRREPVLDRLLEVTLEASKWTCDQDALNFVCKGRIAPLDPRWNVQLGDYCLKEQIALTGDEMWIGHFTGSQKPWQLPARRFSCSWWRHVDDFDLSVALWRSVFGVGDAVVRLGKGVAVSVIVPVYNAEAYLVQTLGSLAAQTLRNIEVICVDDGSTDGSGAICERFAKADARFKVLSQANSGAAVARNYGIDKAKGKWLFFADADDFCRPDMLEGLLRRGEECGADVVIAGHYVIDARFALQVNEHKVSQANLQAEGAVKCTTDGVDVFSGSCTVPWNKLFRRTFVVRNGICFHQIPSSDDVFFSLVSLVKAKRLCFVDKAYYYYRRFLPTSQMGREEALAPTNFLKAFLEVKKVIEGCDQKIHAQFFKVAISVCFLNFARRTTIEGVRKTYFALRDGGIRGLQFDDVDDKSVDLGRLRNLYELTKSGADLDEVLLACYTARRDDSDMAKKDEKKSNEVAELRELVATQKERAAAQDAALKEAWAKLKSRGEESAERLATIRQQRSEILNLRGAVAKQKERGDAQDAALKEAWAKLKSRGEESAERFATIKQQRSEILKLRDAVAKQKERGATQDAALKGAWEKLKTRSEESAAAIKSLRAEIKELRGAASKQNAALKEAWTKLKARGEESAERLATIKRQRSEILNLRSAVAKQKERGDAKDAALKEAWAKLKARGEELAERLATIKEQQSEILNLRGTVAKQEERGMAQDKAIKEASAKLKSNDQTIKKQAALLLRHEAQLQKLRDVVDAQG